jgi:hypothetical protein
MLLSIRRSIGIQSGVPCLRFTWLTTSRILARYSTYSSAELGVPVEEDVERLEAAQGVLGEVGAVDPDDHVLAPPPQDPRLLDGDLRRPGQALEHRRVDRDRVRAHPDVAALPADLPLGVVDRQVEQVLAAQQEVARVAVGVEGDHVVGEQAPQDPLADVRRQDPPVVRLAPRDVDEVVEEGPRMGRPDRLRRRVEVVVVEHHDAVGVLVELRDDRVGEGLVGHDVAVLPGVQLLPAHVRRVAQVPEVVLDEPEHRVGDDVVVLVVGLGLDHHEPAAGLDAEVHGEAAALRFRRDLVVGLRRGGRHPERRSVLHQAEEGRHQAPAAARLLDLAVGSVAEGDGSAVGHQDEWGGPSAHR